MLRKSFFIISLFFLIFFTSCENLAYVEPKGSKDISFSLGEPFYHSVERAVTSNTTVPENPELKIVCEVIQKDAGAKVAKTSKVFLQDMAKTEFILDSVPYGNDYTVSINIFYDDILIYKVLSEPFTLNNTISKVELKLSPIKWNSKINFELNEGKFSEVTLVCNQYFMDSEINLPEPERPLYNFGGWYLDKECKGERINSLGKNLFLGDVTLYALWTGKNQIEKVKIEPADSQTIDYGDTITLSTNIEGAKIYYTTDSSEPDEGSYLYDDSKKIVVDDSILKNDKVTINAIAFKDKMLPSAVAMKKYNFNRYTVKFDKNGHGTAPDDITEMKNGDSFVLPAALTENKMHFLHWKVNGKNLNAGDRVTIDKSFAVNGIISVIAIWEGCVEPVIFSPRAGNIDYQETVTLTSDTAGATIYYTTNGDEPTTSSAIYSNPIVIDNAQTIKAIAVVDGMQDAVVQQAAYTIKTYTVTFNKNGHGTNSPANITGKRKGEGVSSSEMPGQTDINWRFLGWYNGASKITEIKNITADITLTAKWQNFDTVTVNLDKVPSSAVYTVKDSNGVAVTKFENIPVSGQKFTIEELTINTPYTLEVTWDDVSGKFNYKGTKSIKLNSTGSNSVNFAVPPETGYASITVPKATIKSGNLSIELKQNGAVIKSGSISNVSDALSLEKLKPGTYDISVTGSNQNEIYSEVSRSITAGKETAVAVETTPNNKTYFISAGAPAGGNGVEGNPYQYFSQVCGKDGATVYVDGAIIEANPGGYWLKNLTVIGKNSGAKDSIDIGGAGFGTSGNCKVTFDNVIIKGSSNRNGDNGFFVLNNYGSLLLKNGSTFVTPDGNSIVLISTLCHLDIDGSSLERPVFLGGGSQINIVTPPASGIIGIARADHVLVKGKFSEMLDRFKFYDCWGGPIDDTKKMGSDGRMTAK